VVQISGLVGKLPIEMFRCSVVILVKKAIQKVDERFSPPVEIWVRRQRGL